MGSEIHTIVHGVIHKAPEWIRHDLMSKDSALRERAEESLAAMVANALDAREPAEGAAAA